MTPIKHSSSRPVQKTIYQLKITLQGVQRPVWRRIEVPGDITLKKLHSVIQKAMGWTDSHLHRYIIDGRSYSLPKFELDREGDIEVVDESRVRLKSVAKAPSNTFVYEYDFGDNWQHEITVEGILASKNIPSIPTASVIECLAGERACPPEDCGGVSGYEELLQALADPRHEDHATTKEWVGDGFDAGSFDRDAVNRKLKSLR